MDISKSPLEDIKTKKISFNIEIQTLELADDLTKLLRSNRTMVLMSFFDKGISGFIQSLKDGWKKMKKSNPDKKLRLDELLKELSKIEHKHIKRIY